MKEMLSVMFSVLTFGTSLQPSFLGGTEVYTKTEELIVTSPAFNNEKDIPAKYTCEAENIQPPLAIENLPAGTRSIAVVMYDEDAPGGHLVHWVAFNIEPKRIIEENSLPGVTGKNGKGTNVYFGPCPPSGMHYYHFQVYALDTRLKLDDKADERRLRQAMRKHIIGYGELVGRYKKMGMADN